MNVYRVALVGCGQMGEAHIREIYYKENVEISCVCDINYSRADIFKKKYMAKTCETDYVKCVEREDVDIVIIATYPSSHYAILQECLKHKKHVICEKPIAADDEHARRFYEEVKAQTECKVIIGHILRYNKSYKKIEEMIRGGLIGSPIVMRMVQNHHSMDWDRYRNLINETSPIIDCGVHYIDIMQRVTGARVVDVGGIGARTEESIEKGNYNYALITVKLSDDSVGYYEAGWGRTVPSSNIKDFIGPKGRISLILSADRPCDKEEGDLIKYYNCETKSYEEVNINGKRKPTDLMFDDLIAMIEKNQMENPLLDDAYDCYLVTSKADKIIREKL